MVLMMEARSRNSYTTGAIEGHGDDVGGLVGNNRSGTIRRSYWDTETSGITRSDGGIGKTTEQLQSPTDATGIYDEWITANWDFGTSKQYPVLKYALGSDTNNPACREKEDTTKDLSVCGSLLSSTLRYGLSELRLTEGNLSPDFIVLASNYIGTIVNKTSTIRLIPIAINLSAKISIKVDEEMVDEDISSGTTSSAIQLNPNGTTKITIQVKNIRIASPIAYTLYISYHAFDGDIDKDDDGLIEIDTLEKLNAMRYQLDGSGYRKSEDSPKITVGCAEDGCNGYELIRDLDFDDDASYSSTSNKVIWTTGTGWQSIGYYESYRNNKPFQAMFEGNNHTISNLMINRPNTNRVGLFGYTERGTKIANVGLLNVDVRGSSRVGGLVGLNSDGNITNNYVTGDVTGSSDLVGGLVGYNDRGEITNSYATGDVTGSGNYVGGLVGGNGGNITNSYATEAVNGRSYVGGLVGGNGDGNITNSYATSSVTGSGRVGGLVGQNHGSITNSYWDTKASGIMRSAGGMGKTTKQLQSPTTATGIYARWSTDNWDFGTNKQYPILKYVLGPDTDNLACGTGGQPACSTLLPGQRIGPLEQLAVSPDALSPAFDPKTYNYKVMVNYDVDEITLHTTATGAVIRIASNTMEKEYSTSNTSSVTIPLTITGNTVITIEATKDARTLTYILTVSYKEVRHISESVTIKEDDEELKLSINDCGTRCDWVVPKALASLLPEGTSLRQRTVNFGIIPTDYLEASETSRTFTITVGVRREGSNVRKEITLKITKENNGSISSVGQPTLAGSKLTAPEIKLSDDPDGAGEITDYQWQRQLNDKNWINVAGATDRTYTPEDTAKRETYRVQISYMDGQGYCYSRQDGCSAPVYSQAIRDIDTDDDGLIEISTLEELNAIRHQLDGTGYKKSVGVDKIITGCPEGGCKGYELTQDLDFDDIASYSDATANKSKWTTGNGWQPIGATTGFFASTFKGNNYTISNLMIDREGSDNIGLFSKTNNEAKIEGVDLYNIEIVGHDRVGGLVGSNNRGAIMLSSISDGKVTGKGDDIGGLAGSNSGTISRSYASINVLGTNSGMGTYVGGLVGRNESQITDSYAIGNVYGRATLGGLVGGSETGNGNIKSSYAIGRVSGELDKGNIIGGNINPRKIKNSYWNTRINTDITNDLKGKGKTTDQLQSPTTATGLYKSWSTDNWDFGTEDHYPALKNNNGNLLAGQRLGLQSLELSRDAILIEEFKNHKYDYTVIAGSETGSIQITATAVDPQADITVRTGDSVIPLNNGDPSSVALASGDSQIAIVVEANKREVIYTLKVMRWGVQIEDSTSPISFYEDDLVELNSSLVNQATIPSAAYTYQWAQTEGKNLLDESETTTGTIEFTIPTDYVGRNTSSSKAILKLEVTLSKESKQLISSAEIELTIIKKDNDYITGQLGVPELEGLSLTAPDLSTHSETDPDGGIDANDIIYQWQSRASDRDQWHNVDGNNQKTYEIPRTSPFNTQYRVKMGYTDGQGYERKIKKEEDGLVSQVITFRNIDRDGNGLIDILSADTLNAMRYQLAGSGYKESADATEITTGCPEDECNGYELKAHIDLSGYPNWQPIGDADNPFNAKFKGSGYTISNLTIETTATNVGLFGKTTTNTKISNVGLLNVNINTDINADNNVGGLVGSNGGTIEGSYVVGRKIAGGSHVGALVGATSGGAIKNNYATIDFLKQKNDLVCKLIGNRNDNGKTIKGNKMIGGCTNNKLFECLASTNK